MPRPKGGPNKNKEFLRNRLQEMYGEDFHPILKMAANAVEVQKQVDDMDEPQISHYVAANNAWEQIAQYTEPKLKAIEIDGDLETRLTVTVLDLTGESTD
jgi:hypothetical protein